MTLLDLETLTWTWLDDVNGTYFTKAQVDVWLNNAQKECQKQLVQAGENFYVVRASSTQVTNQDTYALPTDFLHLHKFEVVTSGTPGSVTEVRQVIYPTTMMQLDGVSMQTGTPVAYNMRKNCVVLRPIPDSPRVMYMNYSPVVLDMTAPSSIPDVPPAYQEYLAVLATLDGFFRDTRDPTQFLEKKRYYQEMMKQDAQNRNMDAPKEVVVTDDYGMGFLF